MTPATYTVGLDLGQAHDYTAFTVLQENELGRYDLRHVERHRGVSYPALVDRLRDILAKLPGTPSVAVDATGVGRPVVDMINGANLKADIYAITITGADAVLREGMNIRVPKRDLVASVACLLQTSRLRIPRSLPDADVLQHELMAFRAKISLATGHDTYGAWREKDHDDLVLAVALACWLNEHGRDGWATLTRRWEACRANDEALSPELRHVLEVERQRNTAPKQEASVLTRVVCTCGRVWDQPHEPIDTRVICSSCGHICPLVKG